MSAVFLSLSDSKMAALIDRAERRVALTIPGLRMNTAESLIHAADRLSQANVAVVVDCSEEVFRLGYGDLDSLQHLREEGLQVRQAAGLRVGVLVCDDEAWVFSPTALYVADEVHSDETPNAVAIAGPSVRGFVRAVLGEQSDHVGDPSPGTDFTSAVDHREVGIEEVSETEVQQAAAALSLAPPIPFDVARQVRVFAPYIEYVEISLKGCAIQRRRVEVPKAIQGLDGRDEMSARLRTTFDLIERDDRLSSKRLEQELNEIRDTLTHPLGEPWRRVILRSARTRFDERIGQFRQRLESHQEAVKTKLGEHLEESRRRLVEHFLPLAEAKPPDRLVGQVGDAPTSGQVRTWLDRELSAVFPDPEEMVSEMALEVHFRGVTYETLNQGEFASKLRAALPDVPWDKPFEEFEAARARSDSPPTARR
jgi:hypothetical protein